MQKLLKNSSVKRVNNEESASVVADFIVFQSNKLVCVRMVLDVLSSTMVR